MPKRSRDSAAPGWSRFKARKGAHIGICNPFRNAEKSVWNRFSRQPRRGEAHGCAEQPGPKDKQDWMIIFFRVKSLYARRYRPYRRRFRRPPPPPLSMCQLKDGANYHSVCRHYGQSLPPQSQGDWPGSSAKDGQYPSTDKLNGDQLSGSRRNSTVSKECLLTTSDHSGVYLPYGQEWYRQENCRGNRGPTLRIPLCPRTPAPRHFGTLSESLQQRHKPTRYHTAY